MKGLKSYADSRFKGLRKWLEKYQHEARIETLHKLRVEIKKLKVVLLLVKAADKEFQMRKTFVPLRFVFRKAGAIRQGDVLYKLLLLYQLEEAKESRPERQSEKLIAGFQKQVPEFLNRIKSTKKELKGWLKKVNRKDFKRFREKADRDFKAFVYPALNTDQLHFARKLVKQIIYLNEMKGVKTKAFYKKAESILGNWHDKQVLIAHIHQSREADLARMREECEADLNMLRKQVDKFYK